MAHKYRAPAANGAVLAEPNFDAIPVLVEANRKLLDRADVIVGGLPLHELRALARREVLELASCWPSPLAGEGGSGSRSGGLRFHPSPVSRSLATLSRKERGQKQDGPLLLAGHQPELSHPGVWVKNFAINGLAKKLCGIPLHLVVDNDTLKSTSLLFPTFRDGDAASVRLESLAFDTFAGEVPYHDRAVIDAEMFRTFADRAAPLTANWGYEPLLTKCWASARNVGEAFTTMRQQREQEWGCDNLELPVSLLIWCEAYVRFVGHLLLDLPRFARVYNGAIRAYREANGTRSANHPAPELDEGEAPFWVCTGAGKRQRATASSDVSKLRPRALTLTLFARVCLGDFFIHGIGGGKYDEVTDAIIRDYFGIEPPAYQVLSATLHLPLPAFPSTANDLTRADRSVRDLQWNPHTLPDAGAALVSEHAALTANEPPTGDHAARRKWFRRLRSVKEQLRAGIADLVPGAEEELRRVRSEVEANAILQRRDYPWVLYPEETLRPFLQQFLTL